MKTTHQSVTRKKSNTEFDSYAQCSSTTGIPVAALRQAKRKGCPAFRFSKIYLIEFLKWHFAQKQPVDAINVPAEQAKIVRLQREKLEREKRVDLGELVNRAELESDIWTKLLLPLRVELLAFAKKHKCEKPMMELFARHYKKPPAS